MFFDEPQGGLADENLRVKPPAPAERCNIPVLVSRFNVILWTVSGMELLTQGSADVRVRAMVK
jgi:hypothetical protein